MTTDSELMKAVCGLQPRTAALQAQQTEILRVLAEQSETLKSLRQHSDQLAQHIRSIPSTKTPQSNETKPNMTGIANDPRLSLGSKFLPKIALKSNSDLHDLNLTSTELVGSERAPDLVGKANEPTDLDSKGEQIDVIAIKSKLIADGEASMALSDTAASKSLVGVEKLAAQPDVKTNQYETITVHGRLSNSVTSNQVDNGELVNLIRLIQVNSVTVRTCSTASAKRNMTWPTFVKDRGKSMTARRHYIVTEGLRHDRQYHEVRGGEAKRMVRRDEIRQRRGRGGVNFWSRRGKEIGGAVLTVRSWRVAMGEATAKHEDSFERRRKGSFNLQSLELGQAHNSLIYSATTCWVFSLV